MKTNVEKVCGRCGGEDERGLCMSRYGCPKFNRAIKKDRAKELAREMEDSEASGLSPAGYWQ